MAYAFYSLQAIQRGINETSCYTGWMYWLICLFWFDTGLIVGLVICASSCYVGHGHKMMLMFESPVGEAVYARFDD